jgi:hypothetical protein
MRMNTRQILNMSTADFDAQLDQEATDRLAGHRTHKSDANEMETSR